MSCEEKKHPKFVAGEGEVMLNEQRSSSIHSLPTTATAFPQRPPLAQSTSEPALFEPPPLEDLALVSPSAAAISALAPTPKQSIDKSFSDSHPDPALILDDELVLRSMWEHATQASEDEIGAKTSHSTRTNQSGRDSAE